MYSDRPLFADAVDKINAGRERARDKKCYTDCFNIHIKERVLWAIDVTYSKQDAIANMCIDQSVFEAKMALRCDPVWWGGKGLFDMLVSKSGVDRDWLKKKFPNEPEEIAGRGFNPFGLYLGMIFDLGFDLLSRGHIVAVCDDDGLFSTIPPEMFLGADVDSVFNKEKRFTNIRFITVLDMAKISRIGRNKSKTGHVSNRNSDIEKVALNLLNDFFEYSHPKRISKCDAKAVITSIFKVTGKGFENRVWGNRDGKWKGKAGAIPKELKLNSNDLDEYYQQNMPKYVLNN